MKIKIQNSLVVGIIACLVLMSGISAHAQIPITFQQGLDGYEGVHDTFFMTGDPAAINGTSTEWEWDGSDAGGINFGFLRFDDIIGTNPGQVAPDSTIVSAVVTLVVTNEGSADWTMNELINPFDDTMDFFEFGDHSGADPLPGTDYVEDPIFTGPAVSAGDIIEIDVTEYIKKVAGGAPNLGWIFIPGGTNGVGIASSEAGADNRPKLTITIEGVAPVGSRSFSKNGFGANESVDVSIQVDLASGSQDITVVETIPAGWTASAISDGGALADGKITWTLNGFSGSKTLTYTATAPAEPEGDAQFSGVIHDAGNHTIPIEGTEMLGIKVPLYKTGNVLAVGVWNGSNTSSDLAVTAELSDNNGVIYVQDTSAPGGWPSGTSFRWKTVFYADGFGEEEPGWQLRSFTDDTEANNWIIQTDVGFTVGHGGNDSENGETLLDPSEETVYTRSIFDAQNYDSITEMTLKLAGDDEALAWLNGVFLGFTASGTSDRGEMAPDYVFDTTISGGAGGHENGTNPNPYTGSGTIIKTFPIDLVEGEPVSVSDWSIY